jgi:hypothetical protein
MSCIKRVAIGLALFASIASSGCAWLTHYNNQKDVHPAMEQSSVLAMDAKQRVVIASRPEVPGGKKHLRMCSEPSPDALSAIAAGGGISISREQKLNLGTNAALAEAAGSIGLRTQSIQLMRDAMYRLCEGYLSGAIDELAFETMHRRFQSSMVAILAIEQLTGAVRAPTVVLGANAIAGNAERAAELTLKTEEALRSLRQAEQTVTVRQKEVANAIKSREDLEKERNALVAEGVDKLKEPPVLSDDQKKKRARLDAISNTELPAATKTETEKRTALADAEKTMADRESMHKGLDAARQAALAGGSSAGTKFQIETPSGHALTDAAVGQLSISVKEIVKDTLELSFTRELCVTVLLKAPPAAIAGSLYGKCTNYLEATVKQLTADANYTEEAAKLTLSVSQSLENQNAEITKLLSTAPQLFRSTSSRLRMIEKISRMQSNINETLKRLPARSPSEQKRKDDPQGLSPP